MDINLDQTNYAIFLLVYIFRARGCSGPEWTIHAAVAMDSQTEERQDTDTHREAMCVVIKSGLRTLCKDATQPC